VKTNKLWDKNYPSEVSKTKLIIFNRTLFNKFIAAYAKKNNLYKSDGFIECDTKLTQILSPFLKKRK